MVRDPLPSCRTQACLPGYDRHVVLHPSPVVAQIETEIFRRRTRDIGLTLFIKRDGHRTGDEGFSAQTETSRPLASFLGKRGYSQFFGYWNSFDSESVQVYPFVFVVSTGDKTMKYAEVRGFRI